MQPPNVDMVQGKDFILNAKLNKELPLFKLANNEENPPQEQHTHATRFPFLSDPMSSTIINTQDLLSKYNCMHMGK